MLCVLTLRSLLEATLQVALNEFVQKSEKLEMKSDVFLHSCCAPCSISCVENLRNEGIEPHLFWYNPNIHLYAE